MLSQTTRHCFAQENVQEVQQSYPASQNDHLNIPSSDRIFQDRILLQGMFFLLFVKRTYIKFRLFSCIKISV